MATTKRSPLQRAYSNLQKVKGQVCDGKKTKEDLAKAKKRYVTAAERKGQTKTEATKKANRVVNGGCTMSSRLAGSKKKARRNKR